MAEAIVFIICALLPAYGLRFKIGPLPTTGLEIVLFIAIGIFSMKKSSREKSYLNEVLR